MSKARGDSNNSFSLKVLRNISAKDCSNFNFGPDGCKAVRFRSACLHQRLLLLGDENFAPVALVFPLVPADRADCDGDGTEHEGETD